MTARQMIYQEPLLCVGLPGHNSNFFPNLGHDCSIRLWNLETKTCVQEITAHRKKFDESIFDVAFHPSKPYIASAGADVVMPTPASAYAKQEKASAAPSTRTLRALNSSPC